MKTTITLIKLVIAAVLLFFTTSLSAATNEDILLTLEEPLDGSTYSGISNIRGWAVAPLGIERIELLINGEFRTNIPAGGRRSDVGAAFPDFPNSDASGFAMAFNYSNLVEGQNLITVRAVDSNGDTNEASVAFNVTRFANTFISDASRINLATASLSHDNSAIIVDNLIADGQVYDIRLDWRTATQGFAITQITSDGMPSDFAISTAMAVGDLGCCSKTFSMGGRLNHESDVLSMATNGEIILTLEEPLDGSAYSGVSNIRGWAVAPLGIERIELLINGEFRTNIPAGGRRTDVGAAFPDFPNSDASGFAMAFNYSNLVEGQNLITVRAVDSNGDTNEVSVAFNVTRFANTFISEASRINLATASLSHDDSAIIVENLIADGQVYDIRLDWRTATQGFAITQIVVAETEPPPPCVSIAGIWNAKETATVTCKALGESETLMEEGEGRVNIRQDNCNISYTAPNTDISRVGTIEGNNVSFSGPFLIPLVGDVKLTQNKVTLNGTVDGNRMDVAGSGMAEGTLDGVPFSCSGSSKTVFTRPGA